MMCLEVISMCLSISVEIIILLNNSFIMHHVFFSILKMLHWISLICDFLKSYKCTQYMKYLLHFVCGEYFQIAMHRMSIQVMMYVN